MEGGNSADWEGNVLGSQFLLMEGEVVGATSSL
jgi:hypothetical protein